MRRLLILCWMLCALSAEAATVIITNWSQFPTAVPSSGDVILMQKGGINYYFTPAQLAVHLSTNESLLDALGSFNPASSMASNAIANLNGKGTNITFYDVTNLTSTTHPSLTASRVVVMDGAKVLTNGATSSSLLDNFFAMGITSVVASTGIAIGTNGGSLVIANTGGGNDTNKIGNLNGLGTNTTVYTALNLAGPAIPTASNSVDAGSSLLPFKTNWVNDIYAKSSLTVKRTNGVVNLGQFIGVPRGDGFEYTFYVNYAGQVLGNGSLTMNGDSAEFPGFIGAKNYMIGGKADILSNNVSAVFVANSGPSDTDYYQFLNKTDSTWRVKMNWTGKQTWGPGGTNEGDTTLYRLTNYTLKTDGDFVAGSNIMTLTGKLGIGTNTPSAQVDILGVAGTSNTVGLAVKHTEGTNHLARFIGTPRGDGFNYTTIINANNQIIGNGSFTINGESSEFPIFVPSKSYMIGAKGDLTSGNANAVFVSNAGVNDMDHFHFLDITDTTYRMKIGWDGKQTWGPGGSAAGDTTLYRSAIYTLKTDANLSVGSNITTVTGSLGIGTATPSRLVELSAASPVLRLSAGVAGQAYLEFLQNSVSKGLIGYSQNSSTMQINFGANFDALGMAITSLGNIGIGTNNAAARLQVTADNSVLKGFRFGTTNRPDLVWFDTNGVVGIASSLIVTNTISAPTNTAAFTINTNNFSLDTYYTNSGARAFVSAVIGMTNVLATEKSHVALYLDQDGDGTWERTGINCRLQGVIALAGAEQLSSFVQPTGRFIFTNLGTVANAAIEANSSQWVRQ